MREETKVSQLGVSPYDRVTGILVALLILSGLSIGILIILLILEQLLARSTHRISAKISNAARSFGAEQAQDVEPSLEQPRQEELAVATEPRLDLALASVVEAATTEAIAYESDFDRIYRHSRPGKSDDGTSSFQDDGAIIPRWKRWQVHYSSDHIGVYARQLDYFGIELGAVGGAPNIDYVRKITSDRPLRRQGPGSSEDRIYFSWSAGNLKKFDQELLERAGIRTEGRLLLQFYPDVIEDRMAWLELVHAKKHGHSRVQEILRTHFGVRSAEEGYEFYVMEQLFRSGTSN